MVTTKAGVKFIKSQKSAHEGPGPVEKEYFFQKTFRSLGKGSYICSRLMKARVAQLVEHDLAKVGVAGSNPVSRSVFFQTFTS